MCVIYSRLAWATATAATAIATAVAWPRKKAINVQVIVPSRLEPFNLNTRDRRANSAAVGPVAN